MKQILRLYYDSSTDAAIIGSSAQLAGSAIQAMSVANSSEDDREFMIDMYNKQRADAIADREYSSPTATMARLKDAGLNPNLVYGNGGAQAQPVRGSSFTNYHREVPNFGKGVADAVGTYMQTRIQGATLNNLEQQNQVLGAQKLNIDADTQLKQTNVPKVQADTAKTIAETTNQNFQNSLNEATKDALVAARNNTPIKQEADIAFTLDENQRKAISNVVSVKEGLQRLLNMDAQRSNLIAEKQAIYQKVALLEKDNELKRLDIEYINKTDNTGRPNEGAIAKLVELIYGKLVNGQKNKNPKDALKNLPPNIGGYILPGKE